MPTEVIASPSPREKLPTASSSWPAWISVAVVGGFWLILIDRLRLAWETNDQYSYGWFVPLLAAYLFHVRWPSRPEPGANFQDRFIAGAFASLGLGYWTTRLIHESNPEWTAVSWLMAITVVAITLLAIARSAGWTTARHFAFPVCFFLVAVPWPLRLEMPLTQSLMQALAQIVVEVLNWCGVGAVSQGNLIQIAAGTVGVDEACSGVRSLQSMLMASLFLGELQRLSILSRCALVAAGLAVAVLFNVLRALILVVIVLRSGLEALAAWHDPAGYSIFAISFAALCLLVWLTSRRWTRPPPAQRSPISDASPSLFACAWRPLPTSVLLLLGGGLLLSEASTEAWYRAHETSSAEPFVWRVVWPESRPSFQPRVITSRVAKFLAYSEGREGSWRESDGSRWLMFAFRWNPGRTSSMSARQHRPEICLPGGGQKLVQEFAPTFVQVGDRQLPFRTYHFDQAGQPLFVFFCLWENGNRDLAADGLPQEYGRASFLARVRSGQRNLGQQSAEIILLGPPTMEAAVAVFQGKAPQLFRPSL